MIIYLIIIIHYPKGIVLISEISSVFLGFPNRRQSLEIFYIQGTRQWIGLKRAEKFPMCAAFRMENRLNRRSFLPLTKN